MRQLAIDTTGRACSIALFEEGRVIAQRHELIGRGHAEMLLPWIAELPEGGKADIILVGCGPGSFTGVRVGIAAARGLGLGWGVPVFGMDTMSLIAAAVDGEGPLLVVLEGGHGELFIQPFVRSPIAATAELQSLRPEEAAQLFDCETVVGSGAQRFLDARGFGRAIAAEADASLALCLSAPLRSFAPQPVYGRAPDAKVPQ